MATYLIFGISGIDMHDARSRIEQIFGIRMEEREGQIGGGRYFRSPRSDDESFLLKRNFDEMEDEWTNAEHKECGLLLYIDHTQRSSFVREALAGFATFVSSEEI